MNFSNRARSTRGFTFVEILVVVALILVVMAFAIPQIRATVRGARVNTAAQTVTTQMRRTYQRAIDERRIYRLSFVPPRRLQIDRVQLNPPGAAILTFIGTIDLPPDMQFLNEPGIPTTVATTPDGFGTGNRAIDFAINNGGGGTQLFFFPDGRILDANNRLNNGVVYIARPGELLSSRAVTVFGATGRVKGWRLVQAGGGVRWTQ